MLAKPATWADSAAANTEVVITGDDDGRFYGRKAVIVVHNPSAVTALSVTPRVRVTDRNGAERLAEMLDAAAFTVPANSTRSKVVDGMGIGKPDLSIKNVTALGVGQGFTAEVVIQYP